MVTAVETHEQVKQYYGEVLSGSADLKTDACCPSGALPHYQKEILAEIHPEILEKFYGCGSPIPLGLEGKTVLDLGCGTGRDVYLLSKLVGPSGRVIGVDMTEAQLEVADKHRDFHTSAFGLETSNVTFHHGLIEDLAPLGIADASIDVVVSNCVLNLSPHKAKLFGEIFRVLKPGGELYFADIFAGRRIPKPLQDDAVLRGECLSGAMYIEDFRRLLREQNCLDYRVVANAPLALFDQAVIEKVGMIPFHSMTVRAFKLDLEDLCEDYGQVAIYKGSLPYAPHAFTLDDHHVFEAGKAIPVCGNTADMLAKTRFRDHFQIIGDKSVHYGVFDCSADAKSNGANEGACC